MEVFNEPEILFVRWSIFRSHAKEPELAREITNTHIYQAPTVTDVRHRCASPISTFSKHENSL